MQKRDFILLSTVLRDQRDKARGDIALRAGVDYTARAIADAIAQHHTGFDAGRFLADVGASYFPSNRS